MRKLLLSTILIALVIMADAQDYKYRWTADKGNGTFVNPILNGDFPDPDVIRVGDTYYLISTTMYMFPGATIMKSNDLVNWEYCCNPLLRLKDNDEFNMLNGKHKYASGQWASSLQYHNGKFYIHFIADFSGRGYLLTATDIMGEWTLKEVRGYYDNGLLFDDGPEGTGKTYIAYGIGNISVSEINPDTWEAKQTAKVIENRDGLEGAHMYHIGKYYYLYLTTGGYWRGQTIYRSANPLGPYEECPNGDQQAGSVFSGQGIHQGALVETQTGEWWTIMFKDAGAIGRVPYLEPVAWKDGWPIIGNNGKDVSANGASYKKPDVGKPDAGKEGVKYLPTNDTFSSDTLGIQWEWNHNPQPMAWSLTNRKGWLRLYSCTVTDNVVWARGSLTQRIIGFSPNGTSNSGWKPNYGTAKIDVSGMREGDITGLAVIQNPYSFIGVKMVDGKKYLFSQSFKFDSQQPSLTKELTGDELSSDIVYLRALSNFGTNDCSYYYSYTPTSGYKKWGVTMKMNYTLDHFVGQRYYLFNYSTKATGGYVDIDWFSTEQAIPVDDFAEKDKSQEWQDIEPTEEWGFPWDERFNVNIIGTATFAKAAKKLTMNTADLAGWIYSAPFDMSNFNYLVCSMIKSTNNVEVLIYDKPSIWAEPYVAKFSKTNTISIDLNNMVTENGNKIDPQNIYIIAFRTKVDQAIYIKDVFLSDDGTNPTDIQCVFENGTNDETIYDLTGRKTIAKGKGVYIKNGKKYIK